MCISHNERVISSYGSCILMVKIKIPINKTNNESQKYIILTQLHELYFTR